jgi:hypothetical protein
METDLPKIDASCSYGGDDPDSADGTCVHEGVVDKHWGSDPTILRMRDRLRKSGNGEIPTNRRPPIFLLPGLASTRLVAWKFKACPHPLLSDIKIQDYVWLNINLVMQMSTIDVTCMSECLHLGRNQSDADDISSGCKLRPDEGLDAISSLSPGGIGSQLLVGGTNTVYAWLIQWIAENLGYDVGNIIGLPYDWRLSPDKLEERDGFLTLTRRRIEAAVQSNGEPGIMICHSMGNVVFRYFLQWLKKELIEEAYQRYIQKAKRRVRAKLKQLQRTGFDEMTAKASAFNSNSLPWWMNQAGAESPEDICQAIESGSRHDKLWELAQMEGETNWYEWIETHIWTYVGLSAPLLGAVNPLRAVISGENMGLPMQDQDARFMEVSFGSTHTVNPISSKNGFCDHWDGDWEDEPEEKTADNRMHVDTRLACLDDIMTEIEISKDGKPFKSDPWEKFPALKTLLWERFDWDSDIPMIRIYEEFCEEKEKHPCTKNSTIDLGPRDVENGELFSKFSELWREENDPLVHKREQLRESFWDTDVSNILTQTWERPLIKHVIMAYGVDLPTEVGYEYAKTVRQNSPKEESKENSNKALKYDGVPTIKSIIFEREGGTLEIERFQESKGILTDIWKKKPKRERLKKGKLNHSGDGSVSYLSLAWAQTWLLHAVRARRYSGKQDGPVNPLDEIQVSHRPQGGTEWVDGHPPKRIASLGEKKVEESNDTGTGHPHVSIIANLLWTFIF